MYSSETMPTSPREGM